jgi:pilus assembly protein Flp/PilA
LGTLKFKRLIYSGKVKSFQEKINVENLIAKLQIAIMNLKNEEGQDLVEYALLIALIAFACTAGMDHLATSINAAFDSIAGKLTIA